MKRWMTGINLLALLAGLMMIVAMLFPWWSFKLEFSEPTNLYPYLLDGPGSELVGYKRSPQMTLLTGVLITAIVLGIAGSFNNTRRSRILLFGSAILLALSIWRLLARVAGVAARFDLGIQGVGRGNYGGFAEVTVTTWLRTGFYLIATASILVLIAALIQKKVWLRFED